MPISKQNKETLYDSLDQSKRKAQSLEIKLRFQGKDDEADKIQKKTKKLQRELDDLLAKIMENWLGNAKTMQENMNKTNTKLQASIRDIKNKIKVAENVVKVLGYLDDAIDVAGKLLGK